MRLPAALIAAACSSAPPPEPAVARSGPAVESSARTCVTTAPETCFDARDDNCNGLIDEGCGQTTGLVQFMVAWSSPSADVDLLVTDPNGELIEVGALTESGLVKERDCPGRAEACDGRNVENVFLEADREILRGTYRVRIRLEKMGGEDAPVIVHFGARLGPKTHSQRFTFDQREQERSLDLVL